MATPEAHPSRADSLALIGSELALDFCNTASGRDGPEAQEHLQAPEHVLAWARHARMMAPGDCDAAAALLARDRRLASDLLARALELRDVIYRIGTAIAGRRQPPAADVQRLTRIHAGCIARAHLGSLGANYAWMWTPHDGVVEAVLGPLALSALTLLVQSDVTRIKQCAGEHCGWLFFDTTKNKRRRWCDMEVCGNRAKQKAHRARARGGRPISVPGL
jgi:predicted RNA-binding Zn ribbon-like protein